MLKFSNCKKARRHSCRGCFLCFIMLIFKVPWFVFYVLCVIISFFPITAVELSSG